MKKRVISFIIVLVLVLSLSSVAFAASYNSAPATFSASTCKIGFYTTSYTNKPLPNDTWTRAYVRAIVTFNPSSGYSRAYGAQPFTHSANNEMGAKKQFSSSSTYGSYISITKNQSFDNMRMRISNPYSNSSGTGPNMVVTNGSFYGKYTA